MYFSFNKRGRKIHSCIEGYSFTKCMCIKVVWVFDINPHAVTNGRWNSIDFTCRWAFFEHGKDFLFSLCNQCGFVFWKRAELRLFWRVQPGGGLSEDQKVNKQGYKHGYISFIFISGLSNWASSSPSRTSWKLTLTNTRSPSPY